MATRMIIYDLQAPGRDDSDLHQAIKGLASAWWHHLDGCWILRTSLTVSEIRDRLKPYLTNGDELLVVDVTGDPRAWTGVSERASMWLRSTWD